LLKLIRFARRLGDALSAHDAFKSAAAVAFWLFLSLVPLLVFLGFVVGQVARRRGVDALLGPLLDVIPATSEAIVKEQLVRLAGRGAATVAPVSVVSYLWSASAGLHNLMDLFEAMARAPRRPYWRQRALALGWVIAGLLAACALALALVRLDVAVRPREPAGLRGSAAASVGPPASAATPSPRAQDSAHATSRARPPAPSQSSPVRPSARTGLTSPLGQAFAASAMLAVGTLLLASFYRFAVAHPRRVKRRVWPGTLTAVACWLGVSWGFGVYAASIADYAAFYGSLAAVAVLLVWLYLTSLSLIVGAEVNTLLEEGSAGAPKGRRAMSPV
jgi:membrane protein